MTGRTRVKLALDHRKSDGIPVDFGCTAVSGMHASCVAALRDYYGLEEHPVKIHEPYQMLGLLDDDLLDALGVDTIGLMPTSTLFGFAVGDWKEWQTPWGQLVLVPGEFNTTREGNDIYIYPQGDTSVSPSGHMPAGGYFFDAIPRQPEFDEQNLNADDTVKALGY